MNFQKIGILGCSLIAPHSIINPVKEVDSLTVYGVAGRDYQVTKTYAQNNAIPHKFYDYDELLNCPDIDIIYIALPPKLQSKWVIKAASRKKHILVEKPICLSSSEFSLIENECKINKVHLLEAVMVQHHQWQEYIKEIIQKEDYGKLKYVKTQISFEFGERNPGSFRYLPEMGGGAFRDEAIYWLQFIQYIIGLSPIYWDGSSSFSGPNGCDWTFNSCLKFIDNITCEFTCSYELPFEATHWLKFDNAELRIKNFFRPRWGKYKITIDVDNFKTGKKDKIVFPPQNYYINQLSFFSNVVNGIQENIPLLKSYERVQIMEKIFDTARAKL